ncbi:MAG: hypothetical protein L0H23_02350 [Luteimonas sp.]|nr:hypothetical protein [Luteimonas sp.]
MFPIRILVAAALLFAATGACAGIRIAPQHGGVEVRLRGISAVDGDVAWASGREGVVLRTLDGGKHWQLIDVPGADALDFRDIEGFDADTAVILAIGPGEASRVYRTGDGGRSWQIALHNRDPRAFFDCMVFDGQRGWMLGDPVESQFQIHATDDGGRSWTLLPDGPDAADGEAAFAASGSCIARVGTTLVVATGGTQSRVHFRHDGAAKWTSAASGFEAGSESKGVFSMAPVAQSAGFIAVGGDFRAEGLPAGAVRFLAADAPVPGNEIRDGQAVPEPLADARFDATSLPATPGYRSGVACAATATTCIAVGPTGVDAWNGLEWRSLSTTGYDAIDITGHIGWATGDDGRIARIEIDE